MFQTPKGCVDLFDKDYYQIDFLKQLLRNIFESNGGIPLETPVFEYKSVLINSSDEETETKLVFNLQEDDSEPLTLRYDNTIPFIRFIKENRIQKVRRYTIGKVYRRDNPQLSKGRLREFYQADFDILGESNTSMLAELTLLNMVNEFLDKINQKDYIIYINDTKNLKYILCEKLQLNPVNFKKVCRLIDKIEFDNLESFDNSLEIQKIELLKYFTVSQLEELKEYLKQEDPLEESVLNNYNKLIDYMRIWNISDKIRFTNCLARGLDYYNGFIFEVKISEIKNTIIAGGRYDGLIEDKSLIGVSFGVSRIYELLKVKLNYINNWKDIYYVSSIGKISIEKKIEIVKIIKTKLTDKTILYSLDEKDKKLTPVITECIQNYYRYLIIIAENELKENQVILKNLELKTQELLSLE